MAYAVVELKKYYIELFFENKEGRAFLPKNYIADRKDVAALSSFFSGVPGYV